MGARSTTCQVETREDKSVPCKVEGIYVQERYVVEVEEYSQKLVEDFEATYQGNDLNVQLLE